MLSLLAAIAIHQVPNDKLRTILPNGAAIYAERMPKQPLISIQLFACCKYTPESVATHGYRHLLEHLLAKGQGGTLDKRLEAQGCFLEASTGRDAMRFAVSVAPSQLSFGLAAIQELLRPLVTTQQEIDREAKIIEQELALSNDSLLLTSAAWNEAYGESGLDPQGDLPTIRTATPEKLTDVQKRQFAPSCLALAIVGDIDVDNATKLAKAILQMPEETPGELQAVMRPDGKAGRADSDGFGEARAALIKPFGGKDSAAKLAFAFAAALEIEGAFVSYVPSMQNGLVSLGRTDQTSGVGLYVDALDLEEIYTMLPRGRALAKRWIEAQLERPDTSAYLHGLLLCQKHSVRPDDFLVSVDELDDLSFEPGAGGFMKQNAVISVGVR